jgi:hypothetical protein
MKALLNTELLTCLRPRDQFADADKDTNYLTSIATRSQALSHLTYQSHSDFPSEPLLNCPY